MGILDAGFDPKTQGLLAAAFQGLSASGPSRMPMSLGQIIGQAGTTGLNEYQQAALMAQKKKQAEVLMALEQQRAESERLKVAKEAKQQAALEAFQGKVAGGGFADRGALYQGMLSTPGLLKEGLTGRAQMEENALKRQEHKDLLDVKIAEAKAARQDKLAADLERQREALDSKQTLAEIMLAGRKDIAQIAGSMRQPPAPIVVSDEKGNTKLYDRTGGLIKDLGAVGKAVEKPVTEVQGKANLYQSRAVNANRVITELEGKYSPAEISAKQGLGKVWGIGGALEAGANVMMPKSTQKVEQAQRDFVNAILRQESGAAIADSEFANAQKQYFPQPGDAAPVIAQKKANRETAIAGLQVMAGPAMKRRASDQSGAVVDFSELPK